MALLVARPANVDLQYTGMPSHMQMRHSPGHFYVDFTRKMHEPVARYPASVGRTSEIGASGSRFRNCTLVGLGLAKLIRRSSARVKSLAGSLK